MLKIFLSIFTIALVMSCASQKNDSSNASAQIEFTLNVTMTSKYCGGAAPSDEMIAELKKPKQFNNKAFHISTEESLGDNMTEVKTSASGNVSLSLEKGTYYVFLPAKISANHTPGGRTEAQCNKWKNTPNGSFTVKDNNDITFNIHETCNGCGMLSM